MLNTAASKYILDRDGRPHFKNTPRTCKWKVNRLMQKIFVPHPSLKYDVFPRRREHSLVELTEHDDSAANIIVHSMYTYMYCCIVHNVYQVSIMNGRRSGTREKSRKQALDSAWSMKMSRLMRHGTAEHVSRDQKFSGAIGDK